MNVRNFINSYKNLSFVDFFRKIILKYFYLFSFGFYNKLRALLYFKSANVKIGKKVTLLGLCNKLIISDDISIYNNCVFELGPNSTLILGKKIIFSYGCIICVNKSLIIGSYVQIGEYTSIRDTTHDYSNYGIPIMENNDKSESILIGNNIWIGRNCLICPGTIIEDGVVIGANSIVKGHLKKNTIYAGNPLMEIKKRNFEN